MDERESIVATQTFPLKTQSYVDATENVDRKNVKNVKTIFQLAVVVARLERMPMNFNNLYGYTIACSASR